MVQRRERGEGSLTHDPVRDRWIGRLDLGRGHNGHRIRLKVTGKTRPQARAKLDQLRRDRQAGVDLLSRNVTFAMLAERWLARGLPTDTADLTRENYRGLINVHLVPALGTRLVKDIRAEHIEELLTSMADDGKSASTMRHVLNLSRRILRMGEQRDLLTRNVATPVQTPRGPSKERHGLTLEQARTLLGAVGADRLGNLFTVSLLLGLRPGEAAALRWEDLDLEATPPRVRIRASMRRTPTGSVLSTPKTSTSWRTLALPEPAVSSFLRQRTQQDHETAEAGRGWANDLDLIFTGRTGTPLDPSNVRRVLSRLTRDADLGHMHPHLLRHATASLLSAAGVPIEDISDTLGHRSISVTAEIYRHPIAPIRDGHTAAMNHLALDLESNS